MEQEIKTINIKDLVLWTENPRDPIDENATDQDIVNCALNDRLFKWSLSKLAKEMGERYDFSELPTVVYHNSKPIVYDGNRRMILGKIKHGFVTVPEKHKLKLPDFPDEIPCNVCSEQVALENILRKHSESGSWQPLERDIFLSKHMNKPKSPFLILEEQTGLITQNPHLNQRFVKEEIFNEDKLNLIGFNTTDGKLRSVHNDEDTRLIFNDISNKVAAKKISTRKNRGKVVEILDPTTQGIIDENKNRPFNLSRVNFIRSSEEPALPRRSKRTPQKATDIFGGKLYLKYGEVSNLYRDIVDLYDFYIQRKEVLSNTFPAVIRMSLRLLCETASKEAKHKKIDDYLSEHFTNAKALLDQNLRTTLSNHNVNETSIVQLLHTGAHSYQASLNLEQTLAISVIIGKILTITYGQE